ncbi:MAG: UDP-N-acetylmuramoyl-tripeptide--D-alanyl-D-alanine ligase [Candidatus Shapirobacteria bacterium]|nr:UDP-N-acetylmuramoyl-tripeptide--D-alanyl-D-alanine ligase [Candidatus Shapirobacteria bacterium]
MKFFKNFFHQSQRWLAKNWLKFYPQVTIIGITGSYGKTSTTEAINQVLSEKYQTLKTDLNLDTNFNLPITLLKIRPKHQKLILEYGVDHKNEMTKHLALVKPQIGILTGINPTHSDPDLLGSLANIMSEKSKLIESLPKDGLAILNWDDKNIRKMANKFKAKIIKYGFGLENKNEYDFYAEKIKVDFTGTKFTLVHKNYSSIKSIQMETGLIGRHFVQSCLAAAIIGLNQGLSWQEIKKGLSKLKPLSGRLSIEQGPLSSILINDSLRANPASTLAGLQTLADLTTKKRRIAVLGEMGELGESAEEQHRIIGEKVAQLKIDFLIAVGSLQKITAQQALKSGMPKNQIFWVTDVFEAAKVLKNLLKKDDLFYLKGSRLKHMERILLILKGKKVDCKVNSCHFYYPCQDCLLRETTKDIIKTNA